MEGWGWGWGGVGVGNMAKIKPGLWFYSAVMRPKDADIVAKTTGLNKTPPFGSALFPHTEKEIISQTD